jgi:hypothetical protein
MPVITGVAAGFHEVTIPVPRGQVGQKKVGQKKVGQKKVGRPGCSGPAWP